MDPQEVEEARFLHVLDAALQHLYEAKAELKRHRIENAGVYAAMAVNALDEFMEYHPPLAHD